MHIEKIKTQALQLGVELGAQFRNDFTLGQPRRNHVIPIRQHRPHQGLRHDGNGQGGDDVKPRPFHRRVPAERINWRRLGRIEGMTNDIDDHAEQLKTDDTQQEQEKTQCERPQTIHTKAPREREQAANQLLGGVSFAGRINILIPGCIQRR